MCRLRLIVLLFPLLLAAQDPPAQPGQTSESRPLSPREKFDSRVVQAFGLRGLVGTGMGAAIGQSRNVPREWGQGLDGYATRYAAGFGTNLSRQSMAFALETALHEDPRYWPSTKRGFRARLKSALVQALVTRTDSGADRFAYARVASAFGAGQLANAWSPKSTNSVGGGVLRGLIILGGDAGYNVLQEFFPWVRPRTIRH